MCKENIYAKMEKLEAQIWRFTRQGLKVMPCTTAHNNPTMSNMWTDNWSATKTETFTINEYLQKFILAMIPNNVTLKKKMSECFKFYN